MKCGRLLTDMKEEYCRDCREKHRSMVRGLTGYDYSEEWVREMIARVKYHNARQLLDEPCRLAAGTYRQVVKGWNCQCLVPVPVHRSRRKKRGFNQAEEIAGRLGAVWRLPVETGLLFRVKKTLPQKELDPLARMTNLMTAFQADQTIADRYQRVLLVDDIYTTGATAEACTRALIAAGIDAVYVFALAAGRDL